MGPAFLLGQSEEHPHRVYLGPDVFYRNYEEKLKLPLKSHDHGVFYGFQLGYDYKKNNTVYGAFDFAYAWGNVVYNGSLTNLVTSKVRFTKDRSINRILNTEIRLGFNAVPKTLTQLNLIPYLGFGYLRWHRDIGYKEIYSWEFLSGGLLTTYDINEYYNLGLNIKAMRMINGKIKIHIENFALELNLGNLWQFGVELPMTIALNFDKTWDLRFVPYYYQKNIGKSNSRTIKLIDIEDKFISMDEPSSHTYIIGSRLELGYSF